MKVCSWIAVAAIATLLPARDAAAQVLLNGNFELKADGVTPSVVGQVNVGGRTLQGWTVGAPQNSSQAHGFVFVVDSNADSTGFPSENSPPNIKLWGPNSGSNNGFTGSPTGGKFLGVDADYATALVSQTLSGLVAGQQYTVAFDWAGSQFTDQSGATTQWWQVGFGSNPTQDTTHTPIASQGFSGWIHSVMTFTATSTNDVFSLQAKATPFTNGAPAGLPPFLLIDGITITPVTSSSVPEPSQWVTALVCGVAVGGSHLLRRARRKAPAAA